METKVVNKYKESYTVYIGRGSIWGNPFTHRPLKDTKASYKTETREEAISKYREYLLNSPELLEKLPELEGETLGCFCKPQACHGDVLVEVLYKLKNGEIE